MQKNIVLVLIFFSTSIVRGIPHPSHLKKVYKIEDAQAIEFVRNFSHYEDTFSYGLQPNSLDISNLTTLNNTIDWSDPLSYGIKCKKSLYIAKMKGAFISSYNLGTVFDCTQQLLFDITVAPGYPIFWPLHAHVSNSPLTHHCKIATVQGPTLFYHWVIDRMPSIFLMKDLILQDPEIKLIINNRQGVSGYVYEYLDLLGIPQNQLLTAQSDAVYQADSVYFATPFLMEPIPKKLLLAMRTQLLDAAKLRPSSREYDNNLIVVIQRTESDRRIKNLPALLDLLSETFIGQGYEILVFDAHMSVSEQIKIFNNARLIIGVMASGLTNVLYANPGTKVIEIHPEADFLANKEGLINGGAEWCWWLSAAVGLDYWVVNTKYTFSDHFVTIPLEKVKKVLQKMNLINGGSCT